MPRRRDLVVDARLSNREVLLSAGRRLVFEKGYLHTFLRRTQALKEYPAISSKRSCQCARVMRFMSCSSIRRNRRDLKNLGLLNDYAHLTEEAVEDATPAMPQRRK
ncbi:hypothetical protein ElyMa_001151200 [Elysia marginata]|uniref:Uncharacterized protein n=1 Tax=Elysia marginata TaxID=1093978 RepID=A0AAV4I3C1_9GAST|nr:hypothetical protein ElyMa_001151200 [Elysia marginata]